MVMLNRDEIINVQKDNVEPKKNELDMLTKMKYVSNIKTPTVKVPDAKAVKFDPEDMIKNLSKINSSYEILKNSDPKSINTSTVNVPGKGNAVEIKAMFSNAIRFHNSINHNIKDKTIYNLYMKFSMDNNNIVINDFSIIEKFDESIVPESSMNEKYDEYNALINDKIKPNKTIKNRFKQMFSIS